MTSEVLQKPDDSGKPEKGPMAHPAIDKAIRAKIKPLSMDDRTQLEASLVADGCRDPILVWQEKGVVLDGHYRLEICKRLGIEYQVKRLRIESRDAVNQWLLNHQRQPIPTYPIHPAANEFPMLDEQRLAKLAYDIAARGLLEPIGLFDGQILDGRNRLKACAIAGVDPRFATVETDNPWMYVWSKNGQRRDLSDMTRNASFLGCQAGAEAYEMAKVEAEGIRREGISDKQVGNDNAKKTDGRNTSAHLNDDAQPAKRQRNESNRASATLAKQAGTSRATMEKVLAIKHHDEQHGTKYIDQIKTGAIKPTKALTTVRKANLAAKTKAQMEQTPTRPVIKQQDALAFLADLPETCADLLLTDPPYSTDVEDLDAFIASWLPLALSRIKPTGRAYICIGAYPGELRAYLNALAAQDRMTLANVLVWTYRNTMGPSPKIDYKLNWQAILYLRGPEAADLDCPMMTEQFSVLDINAPDGRQGDRYHAWQKPIQIGERFVRHATAPGGLVIDPFACTGTFLLAAASLGREAIGCDLDAASIEIATSRGCVLAEQEARYAA